MFDINLSEAHTDYRRMVRAFARRELAPLADDAERSAKYPKQLLSKAAEVGLIGLTVPEEFGGSGAGSTFKCIATEELSQVSPSLGTPLTGGLGMALLASIGTESQRKKYLQPTIDGVAMGAFAMTEPSGGSDVLSMDGTAVRTSAGWRITANKMYITAAPICDYYFVVVYTNKAQRGRGVSIFMVDSDTPGIEVSVLDKLGHRPMETGAVFFDIEVSHDALLGEEGMGMSYIKQTLTEGRLTHAARSVGVARSAYDLAAEYAGQRSSFGSLIGKHQAIQFKISRMMIDIRSAALHVMHAAAAYDNGSAAVAEASAAKVVASEAAVRSASEAMQILGGTAYMMESPVQRILRDAYLYPISEGTTEIQLRTLAHLHGIGVGTASGGPTGQNAVGAAGMRG